MSKLKKLFQKYKERSFRFIEPGGNIGDYLIYAGAKQLAHQVGIRYETVHYKRNTDSKGRLNISYGKHIQNNDIIYIHGGGGFNSWWGEVCSLFGRIKKDYPDNLIIVGPSTSSLELDYLREVLPKDDHNIIFFARERTTYHFIKDNFYSQTYIDHDTALSLSKEDRLFKEFTKNIRIENNHKVLLLRKDLEKVPLPETLKNNDAGLDPILLYKERSYLLHGIFSLLGISKYKWLNLHLKASTIITNRLHSAIIGTILGKNVELFRNSYHKNRSVWEYSLQSKGVKWIE